ncbi:MAG: hypothetical protein CSA38_03940 [Flavobacteriales bacterium]|nr:MAG: hypothetical protein CSA38_03940 [Flavobacteriales bacterium]
MKHFKILFILIIINNLAFNSCKNREETIDCFPNVNINVSLNLNLPAYQPLQNVGGWVYINEQNAGTKGLLLIRTTNGFIAYDRNAPHICPSQDTRLKVENDIKIICPKDGAEWILLTGEPVKIAEIPPKRYFVYYQPNNNHLTITN